MNKLHQRLHTEEDIDAYAQYYAAQARDHLWAFRRLMDPKLVVGWFPHEVSHKFQLFFNRLMAGERPKLILMAPPQHGKTRNLHHICVVLC
jgi:hypothetical protein